VCRGDPVHFSVNTFSKRDLEVQIHGVADVPIGGSFIGFGVTLNSGLEPFDLVLKCEDRKVVDFFVILDGLDQTGGDFSEGDRVNIGVGGEYVFHSTRGVAGWG